MKVVVLNGSPKGTRGITLQYARYLEKKLGCGPFDVVHASHDLARLERDEALFGGVIDAVSKADLVLWCTPVYYLVVPAQLERFVELVHEKGRAGAFAGRYSTTLTTSVHFFDTTAHDYLHAVSEDLGMAYLTGYSATSFDLLDPRERRRLVTFGKYVVENVERRWPVTRRFSPLARSDRVYAPAPADPAPKSGGKRVVILSDARPDDRNLRAMIAAFSGALVHPVEVVDLHEIDLRGGCLGCCRCGYDNTCCYTDGFRQTLEQKVLRADALILAASVRDRFLSARWKTFFDRLFYNGHVPTFDGKVWAQIVSGPLSQLSTLREVLDALVEVQGVASAGTVTDEDDPDTITAGLTALARRVEWALSENLSRPRTFHGIAGHMILRDLVHSLDWFFRADHRYYAAHGLYDYPTKSLKKRFESVFMSVLTSFAGPRKQVYDQAVDRMVAPLAAVVDARDD